MYVEGGICSISECRLEDYERFIEKIKGEEG